MPLAALRALARQRGVPGNTKEQLVAALRYTYHYLPGPRYAASGCTVFPICNIKVNTSYGSLRVHFLLIESNQRTRFNHRVPGPVSELHYC